LTKVKRALISVSDKTGVVEFASGLTELGVEILSTGGTAKKLREAGLTVKDVSEYTGFPEMMDGRVKTLHPKVHAALLALRDNPEHMRQIQEQKVELIDMVVVNLYPFQATIAKPDVSLEDAIENIDIGGPTMLRSSAKNFKHVAVVTDPNDYEKILSELKTSGEVSAQTKSMLAVKA
jgi:phosphoribosylaminoimidazolecarboxamide formyltransferase/IMP cyclohydrolase